MVDYQLIDTIYTTIATIVLIGSMIFGGVRWQASQAEKKTIIVKNDIENAAKQVREETDRHITDLKTHSDSSNKDLEIKIENLDRKVDALLKRRLRTRG